MVKYRSILSAQNRGYCVYYSLKGFQIGRPILEPLLLIFYHLRICVGVEIIFILFKTLHVNSIQSSPFLRMKTKTTKRAKVNLEIRKLWEYHLWGIFNNYSTSARWI